MLPSDLPDLHARLDELIRKHGLDQVAEPIKRVTEAMIDLSEDFGKMTFADMHKRAMEIDPTIPADPKEAEKRLAYGRMWDVLRGDAERKLAKGATRFGGMPDLPPEIEWPKHHGRHLVFLGQIDLSSLPRWADCPLPKSGWLWAFASGEQPESALLYWNGEREMLQRRETPPKEEMHLSSFDEPFYKLIAVNRSGIYLSLPGYGSDVWDERVEGNEELEDAFMDMLDPEESDEDEDAYEKGGAVKLETDVASLLGRLGDAADLTPNELAEQVSKEGDDWRPLLEISSVGSMIWSDSGSLAFLIRESDLLKGDFSQTFAVINSS